MCYLKRFLAGELNPTLLRYAPVDLVAGSRWRRRAKMKGLFFSLMRY